MYRLLIYIITAIVFASCSKGTVETRDDESAHINFSTILSRASSIGSGLDLAQAGGFTVWAYNYSGSWSTATTRASLMDDVRVTSSDGISWTYGSPVYWPVGDRVSFFAYGPANSATPAGVNAQYVPLIDFAVGDNPATQTDLFIATQTLDQLGPDYIGGRPVNMLFNHALSQIKLSAILSGNFTEEVKVTGVAFKNIYYRGQAAVQMPVSWSVNTSGTKDYRLTTANGLLDIALSTTAQPIVSSDGMMFLLPQLIDRTESQPAMEVTLSVGGVEVKYTIAAFGTEYWLPGKSYDYQLVISEDDLQVIVIDSDITLKDWNVNIMIQPVPLAHNPTVNMARLKTALSSLATLNKEGYHELLIDNCKYFALYVKNDITHDITIDMADYTDSFTQGEYVMFDVKKLVESWEKDEATQLNYKFEVVFNPNDWQLGAAAQPPGENVDGATYATTTTPSNVIRNKGSVILIRK